MSRLLLRSTAFVRAAKRMVAGRPQAVDDLRAALQLLADDSFHPALRTHKLKGKLAGSWSASAGADIRIVFRFVQHEDKQAILLETVGSHDDVY